ncbi:flavin reductase family protein [Salinibacterium sp. SWN1162]|uniref:flavin reductase family protein n=1 Tax=Salinibacterium sp. SWN1162 TaxID=2792053 RepID=UPI0018CED805|nr:flavin reductase family protein [Salinibacterium sp. SWN1162]MBH0009508.1 flavin reductase family protein [Salinibacterium sp. SWN1162]
MHTTTPTAPRTAERAHITDDEALLTSDLSAAEFAAAFRRYPGGVAVVTADSALGPVALTVTSIVSVSADPPLFAFSIGHQASTATGIRNADSYVVHFLGSEQLPIAELCATSGVDRFADSSLWSRLPTGEPYFPSAPVRIVGQRVDQLDTASASLILVLAKESHIGTETDAGPPLVYHDRGWHELSSQSQLGRR